MNAEQQLMECDDRQLELYLDGALSDETAHLVENHLSECVNCQKRLESIAANGDDWSEARKLLHPDDIDLEAPLTADGSAFQDSSPSREATMLSREIRGWLDPTDDPNSLGRFAGYEVVGIVGHGGMGIVLKGFESSLNRFVAIKILAPRLATNATARQRFAREAQAAAAVLHENVIAIHRVDEWHGLPFLVMPYVGGVSLQKRLDDEGPLTIEATLRIGTQIAAGLAAAHDQGLVHRDIKPANILLDQGVERVTITDFGLARAADDASMTRTGIVAGTPQYMSPEQAAAKSVDARSDLFSLGSVLYAMATGRPPFRGEGSFEVLKRIGDESARDLHEVDATIPVWFANLVKRLHAKSVDDRPQSAAEVQRLMNVCLLHVTQPNRSIPSELLRSTRNRKSRKGWIVATSFVAVALATWFFGFPLLLQVIGGNRSGDSDPVPQAATKPAKEQGKQIGTVLGKPIYEGDLNENVSADDNLLVLMIRPLMANYCKQQGIDPEAELKEKIPDEKSRNMALYFVLLARFQKHLYEKHGGRVVLSAFGPMAYDGYRTWIAEQEEAENFEITDPKLKAAFDKSFVEDEQDTRFASPSQIKEAFDPANTERFIASMAAVPKDAFRDPAMKLIGEVLGNPIHLHERYMSNPAELPVLLHTLIVDRLEKNYREKHPELEPTEDEIQALEKLYQRNIDNANAQRRKRLAEIETRMKELDSKSDEYLELASQTQFLKQSMANSSAVEQAKYFLPIRKFHVHIHETYGGGRVVSTPQGMKSFDAQRKWVEQREGLGEFQIADPKFRQIFYDYWDKAEERAGVRLVDNANQIAAWVDPEAGSKPKRKQPATKPQSARSEPATTPNEKPIPANACRVTGELFSSELEDEGSKVTRSIIYVFDQATRKRIEKYYTTDKQFLLHLVPGTYKLMCSANGSDGATFQPQHRTIEIKPNQRELSLDRVDLPLRQAGDESDQSSPPQGQ